MIKNSQRWPTSSLQSCMQKPLLPSKDLIYVTSNILGWPQELFLSMEYSEIDTELVPSCWETSWIRCDHLWACELDLGTQRFLTPSPIIGIWIPFTFLFPVAAPKTQPSDSNVVFKTSAWHTWLSPVRASL